MLKFIIILTLFHTTYGNEFISLMFQHNPTIYDKLETRITSNLKEYLDIIESALEEYDVNMVIFPEYGLTGLLQSKDDVKKFAIEIDFSLDSILNDVKETAKKHNTYIVINFIEKNNSRSPLFYNTNLVFNNKGLISLKYRKRHLSQHEKAIGLSVDNQNENRIFSTEDIGNFILLTGDDLKFGLKPIELNRIKNKQLFNVICPSAIKSRYPFEMASSIYENFVISTGINLLVSQLGSVQIQEAGVYTNYGRNRLRFEKKTNRTAGFAYNFFTDSYHSSCSNLNLNVPASSSRDETNDNSVITKKVNNLESMSFNKSNVLNLSEFNVYDHYTGQGNFSCSITLKVKDRDLDFNKQFIFVAEENDEVIICSLLACDVSQNCSKPVTTRTTFELIEISILTSHNENNEEKYVYWPISLSETLEPISRVNFCEMPLKNVTSSARLNAFGQSKVIAFGIAAYKLKHEKNYKFGHREIKNKKVSTSAQMAKTDAKVSTRAQTAKTDAKDNHNKKNNNGHKTKVNFVCFIVLFCILTQINKV